MLQSWPVRYQRMLAAGKQPQIAKLGSGRFRLVADSHSSVTRKKIPNYFFFIPAVAVVVIFIFMPTVATQGSGGTSRGGGSASQAQPALEPPQNKPVACSGESIEELLRSQKELLPSMQLTVNKELQLGGFRSRQISVQCNESAFAFALTETLVGKEWKLKKLTRLEN